MSSPDQHSSNHATGLLGSASTVGLGVARALTSHARALYRRRYKGRRAFPQFAFVFDLSVFAAALVFIAASLWFAFAPPPRAGLVAAFSAPPVRAAASVPVSVTIRSADKALHRNVRMRWQLPPGVQVLQTLPSSGSDGWIFLGDVAAGSDVTVHAVVRVFVPVGTDVPFGVSISDGAVWSPTWSGTAERTVTASALTAQIPEAFHVPFVASNGVVLPLRVTNDTEETVPAAHVLIRQTNAHAQEFQSLGDMQPRETRWIYVPLDGAATGTARLSWSIGAASRDVDAGSWEAEIVSDAVLPGVTVFGADEIAITDAVAGTLLLTVNPAATEPLQSYALVSGASTVTLAPSEGTPDANRRWLAMPLLTNQDGRHVLGPAATGATAAPFPFLMQVRYLSSAGDQLGAGPHPPRAGMETRYWAFWTVGPTETDMQNIQASVMLAPGVSLTGNVSATDGGSFETSARRIQWALPGLGPTTGVSRATFGFEFSVTPSSDDVGNVLPLIGTSTAVAENGRAAGSLKAISGPQTTHLSEDGDAERAGIVLPASEDAVAIP